MRRRTKTGIPARRRITFATLRAFEARIDRKCRRDYTTSLYGFDAPTLRVLFPARHKALVRLRQIARSLEEKGQEKYLRDYSTATYGLQAIAS